jgi:release factor glutamine methyltransferase
MPSSNTTGKVSATAWVISISGIPDNIGNPQPSTENRAAAESRWTIQRLLDWTTGYFREHGAAQPRLEAEVLLAEALGCQRIFLYTRFDEEPDEVTRTRFRAWVSRHARGEPVAYLVGHREFFSLRFLVDKRVLIPRPETEHVVSEALDFLRHRDRPANVVDVGTGSGNIVVTLAKHSETSLLTAVDISATALELARKNAALHGVENRIRFVESDLLDAVDPSEQFDLIVSNPPYIGTAEQGTVDASVSGYEPHTALFSGSDGCQIIERLIDVAARRLIPGGQLIFEMSPLIADRCRQRIQNHDGLQEVRIVKDLAGHQRVLVAKRR